MELRDSNLVYLAFVLGLQRRSNHPNAPGGHDPKDESLDGA